MNSRVSSSGSILFGMFEMGGREGERGRGLDDF